MPERRNFSRECVFERGQLLVGDGDAIEPLEEFGHAATLHEDGAARDFRGVRRKDGHDEDAAQPCEGLVRRDAGFTHGAQSAAQFAALRLALLVAGNLDRQATTLAVVRFRQVDELEVEREGATQALGLLHRHGADVEHGELHQILGVAALAFRLQLPAANRGLAQLFHFFVQRVSGLLAEHTPQQLAEGAHVTAQRRFLQVAGARFKLSQALLPALGFP